jgi:heme/copper-type cytochrome/quinol oxidase subunit 3
VDSTANNTFVLAISSACCGFAVVLISRSHASRSMVHLHFAHAGGVYLASGRAIQGAGSIDEAVGTLFQRLQGLLTPPAGRH